MRVSLGLSQLIPFLDLVGTLEININLHLTGKSRLILKFPEIIGKNCRLR